MEGWGALGPGDEGEYKGGGLIGDAVEGSVSTWLSLDDHRASERFTHCTLKYPFEIKRILGNKAECFCRQEKESENRKRMDGKAEMERFLSERRRSQKTSLQRILRVKANFQS